MFHFYIWRKGKSNLFAATDEKQGIELKKSCDEGKYNDLGSFGDWHLHADFPDDGQARLFKDKEAKFHIQKDGIYFFEHIVKIIEDGFLDQIL